MAGLKGCLLDTNILISEHANLPDEYEYFVSSLSYAELRSGIKTSLQPPQLNVRTLRLNRINTIYGPGLPFDDAAAASYGFLCELDREAGRNPRSRAIDLMIAATAHSQSLSMMTANVSDFAGITSVLTIITS